MVAQTLSLQGQSPASPPHTVAGSQGPRILCRGAGSTRALGGALLPSPSVLSHVLWGQRGW